jgi:acyl-CoA dehydrogenase
MIKMDFELTPEQIDIKMAVKEFAEKEISPICDEYHKEEKYPFDIIKKAAKEGYIAAFIPEEYGGAGAGIFVDNLIKEEITKVDPGFGMALITHKGLEAVIQHGTDEQKERYLPAVAKGDEIWSYAMTEPQGGSDVSGTMTSAKEDGDYYLLNGTKTFITGAPVASHAVIVARTSPEKHKGLSQIIIDTKEKGVTINKLDIIPGYTLGETGEINLNDVAAPKENLLGELNRGFYHAMEWLDWSRTWVGIWCLGVAEGAFNLGYNYANQRELFGEKIFNFQSLKHQFAFLAAKIEAIKLLMYKASMMADKNIPNPEIRSMGKMLAAELAEEVASFTFTVHGAYGATTDYPVYRFWNSAKIAQLIEGTPQIHREVIGKRLSTF